MGTVNSACIRSDSNHKVTSSVGEPLKGHRSPARIVRKSSRSDDFWNSSTLDKDNSGAQSGESYSTANETLEVGGSGNGNIPSEFVNHGLLLWNQSRQQWLRNKKSENHGSQLHKPRSNPLSSRNTSSTLASSNCLLFLILYICSCFSSFFGIIFTIFGWSATYDSLLTSNKRFTKPIPLAMMVDFLVDIWDQEGMYD